MKNIAMFMLLTIVCSSLFAAKVYRRDGSFTEYAKDPALTARFVAPADIAGIKAPELLWKINARYLAVEKSTLNPLPVYRFGKQPYIANNQIFWRGTMSAAKLAKKYGLTLKEIYATTNLSRFAMTGDAVAVAQKIVEAGDGFAFPDMMRQQQLRAAPVTLPIPDKYYKDGHEWHLKNTGTVKTLNGTDATTVENADIRFEPAMQFIVDTIADGGMTDFAVGTKVAIMDSGVDLTHPDLKNKLDNGWDAVNHVEGGGYGTIDPNSSYGTAGYSHGTDCAGVAAAEGNDIGTTGVCPWCGIYPVHFMDGGTGSADSEQGYIESYEKYVADPAIVAVNCSFGPMAGMGTVPLQPGEEESHLNFLQNGRGGLGGAILYASGNDGVDVNYQTLHSYEFKFKRNNVDVVDTIISVAGSNAWDTRVAYSDYGQEIDVITPTLSTSPLIGITTAYIQTYGDLDSDYTAQFSGTSSATPVVTGAFGVIFSVNPALTLEAAVEILHLSSDKINPATGFWDKPSDAAAADAHSPKFGYGRLNLLKAVRLAAGLDMCDAAAITTETKNGLDDDCDGWVDEGFEMDISTIGGTCTTDADCVTPDLVVANVKCLTEVDSTAVTTGYCAVTTAQFDCPDGTRQPGDGGTYCLKDCNKDNACAREGFYCTEENFGYCQGTCTQDTDCVGDSFCDDEGHCKRNPSEPGGPCSSNEDCLYNGFCVTQVPGGFCFVQCADGLDDYCGDQGAKCVHVNIPTMGEMDLCVPPCETADDCRSVGGQTMACHKDLNGKEDVCWGACSADADCFADDAVCDNGTCVKKGTESDDDTLLDDEDTLAGDAIAATDDTTDTMVTPDTDTGKKSDSGCGCSLAY